MTGSSTEAPPIMGIKEIEEILPHRYPFLLVDKVISLDLENRLIEARKGVTFNEPFFQGHFPGAPIMPGVLVLEALAQTGGILFAKIHQDDKITVLLSIKQAKFRNPVRPGDVLDLRCEGLHSGAAGGRAKARATVDDKLVCEAEIGFALVPLSQL